jgi:hypothetical protein
VYNIYGMERVMRFPLILNSLLKNGNAPRYSGPHLEECRQNRTHVNNLNGDKQ